jgi:hypothetical protein
MVFEMSALCYMPEKEHPRLPIKEGDLNIYTLNELHGHNVVLPSLLRIQGKGSDAMVKKDVYRLKYTRLPYCCKSRY